MLAVSGLILGGLVAVGFVELIDARNEPSWLNEPLAVGTCKLEAVTPRSATDFVLSIGFTEPPIGTVISSREVMGGIRDRKITSDGQPGLFGGRLPEVVYGAEESATDFVFSAQQLLPGDRTYTVYIKHDAEITSRTDSGEESTDPVTPGPLFRPCGTMRVNIQQGTLADLTIVNPGN